MFIAEYFDEFCNYINTTFSSINTQRAYIGDVKEFLEHANDFDKEDIEDYIVTLRKKGLSFRTIKRKLSSISLFFNFLKRKQILKKNPVDYVDKPKMEKNLPKFLDADDVVNLLEKIEDLRDRALLELIYSSSLRAQETIGLNVEDIDFKHLRIRLIRKGGVSAYVPITKRAARYVSNYIGVRKQGALFLNRYNKRLSTRSLQKIVKKYALNNIFKDISPHTLRHSKATHLLNNGMDIRILQKFLGHSSIKATQIYTHLNLEELAKTYDRTHPLVKDEKE